MAVADVARVAGATVVEAVVVVVALVDEVVDKAAVVAFVTVVDAAVLGVAFAFVNDVARIVDASAMHDVRQSGIPMQSGIHGTPTRTPITISRAQ